MSEDPQNDRFDPPPSPTDPPALGTQTTEPPTVEAPAADSSREDATAPGGGGSSSPQPPPTPAESSGSPRRSGILMPMWVVLALAGALLFGLGALSGHLVSSGEGHRREISRSDFRGRMGSDGGTGNRVGPMHPGGDPGNGGRSGNGPGIAGPANAYLGVSVRDSSTPPGAELVRVVASSPAADAGLEVGDVITAIDGAAVDNAAALTSRVRSYGAGDQLTIAYARAGANQTTKATLASRAQLPQQ